MAGVVNKFFITSLIMWAAPIAILYAFNHNLIPGELLLVLFLFKKRKPFLNFFDIILLDEKVWAIVCARS